MQTQPPFSQDANMMSRHKLLGFMMMVGCCVRVSGGSFCSVEHTCAGYGLENLGLDTGEAAFCQGPGSIPLCPGIYINGTFIEGPDTTTTITASSTATTTATTTESVTATTDSSSVTSTTTTTTDSSTVTSTTTPEPATTTTTASPTVTSVVTLPPVTTIVTSTYTQPPRTYTVTRTVTVTKTVLITITPTSTNTVSPSPTTQTSTPIPTLPVATITPTPTTATTATTIITQPPSISCQPASCEGKEAGIYYHQNCNCRLYYACMKSLFDETMMVKREYRCAGDEVFDPISSACTDDLSVCFMF
ncbi:integumentary mucin C.1-like [Portunus trituberculatus]|uniref:integumentary mucin C.1-like n=1 Tax=Portunus trituberculatus TaxID=210409 RepID=UPI001E1CD748|nr:integumentary mucin C.1-like [Portunus trituberculatus]